MLEHQDINDSLFPDLQHAVERGLAVLRDLHKPLTSTEPTDHSKETGAVWLKQIQQTQSEIKIMRRTRLLPSQAAVEPECQAC